MRAKCCIVGLLIVGSTAWSAAGSPTFRKEQKSPPPAEYKLEAFRVAGSGRPVSDIGKRLLQFMARAGVSPRDAAGAYSTQSLRIPAPESALMPVPQPHPVTADANIRWDSEFGTPRLIEVATPRSLGKHGPTVSSAVAVENAQKFLQAEKTVLRMNDPAAEFSLIRSERDELGQTHVRFRQVYRGVAVWAKDIVVHLDVEGNVLLMNGRLAPTPSAVLDVVGRLSEAQAIDAALSDMREKTAITELPPLLKQIHGYDGPTARRVVWHDALRRPHLAFVVEIRPSLEQDWLYFLDANTGNVLNSYNTICYDGAASGTGTDLNGTQRTFGVYLSAGTYYMMDASQPMFDAAKSQIPQNPVGAIVGLDLRNTDLTSQSQFYFVTSSNNQWNDSASISAHFDAITTYNYYRTTHNRNSVDDKGMTIYSIVHVTKNNQPMENAYWSGTVMCYGDGGHFFKPLPGGLDVAAHEMTHGVTQYTANLEYQGQSGALNESMSDVFGAMVDTRNWTMGEDIILDRTTFPTGAMRDMVDPHNGGTPGSGSWQPAKMSEFIQTTQDNGGVHINSGIPNHALYLVAAAKGRPTAEKIWYRALAQYLTRSSQFIDARIATVKAAADLYGAQSSEVSTVKSAWDAVEVFDGTGTPPPPTTKPVGTSWLLLTNTDPNDQNSLYIVNSRPTSAGDYHPISRTGVGNRPAVSDDGRIVVFVDNSHNLRALAPNPQNPQEILLEGSGVWSSVAIGPGTSSLALTSIYQDTTIYYFNLADTSKSKAIKIRTQSYDAPNAPTALFADAMSFDPSGQYLLFDAYNQLRGLGDTLGYWNINIVNISTEQMGSVFPPLSNGLSVGNPAIAKTSSTRFTFDLWDPTSQTDYVMAADFNTGDVGTVAGPIAATTGFPTYSANDDTVAYTAFENVSGAMRYTVSLMPLKADKLNGTGIPIPHSTDAAYPVWFVIGTRTAVDDGGVPLPAATALLQNYPNPFNPSTEIRYVLAVQSDVSLEVYDLLGRHVRSLASGMEAAGLHTVSWDGRDAAGREVSSGLYFYRLRTAGAVQARRMMLLR